MHMRIREMVEYKQWVESILSRDNFTCQECSKCGGDLEVHHLNRFSNILKDFLQEFNQFSPMDDKETLIRLASTYEPFWDISNGQTLCLRCHNLTKGKRND